MLRWLVLVCAAVAVMGNQADDCCSHDDRVAVLHYWEAVWSAEFSHRRVVVASEVFARFIEHVPEVVALFEGVNGADQSSAEFKAHCVRVLTGLDLLINISFDQDTLRSALNHLGTQHAAMPGMKAEYFEVFRQTLEEILPQAIPCFDTEAFERCISIDTAHIEHMLPG